MDRRVSRRLFLSCAVLLWLGAPLLRGQAGRSPVAPQPAAASVRVHYDTGWGNYIAVRGSRPPLSWSSGQPAAWTAGNVWVWHGPAGMSAGGFEFKPLFNDARWSTGANYTFPDGAAAVDVYPFFGNSQGTLQIVSNFYSPQLQNTRALRIYLPPSYAENPDKRYPVIYMHDGQNLFDAATSYSGVEWEVDETLNHLIGIGEVREVLVVGVDNTPGRIYEYTPTPDPPWGGGGGDLYLDFLEHTLKPWVDANYRTLPDAANTLTIGSSLGGLISFYAGWSRPELFGKIGGMSSSFWWDGESLTAAVETHTGALPACVFYIDSGGPPDGAAQTFRMRDALHGIGYQFNVNLFHWYDPAGIHHESSWRDRLPIPLRALLPWR